MSVYSLVTDILLLCPVVFIITHLIKIQGKPLIVKCGVTDFVSGGVFTWRIGQETIPRFVFVVFLIKLPLTGFLLSFGEAEVDDNMLVDSVRFEPSKKVL